MLRYGVNDLRLFFENDLRFLRQFRTFQRMKVPYSWLAEWVTVPWPARELGARLTMAGFELEALEPAAPAFTGVVVAEILSAEPHPQADKLQVCRVSTGSGAPLQIVCGATQRARGTRRARSPWSARSCPEASHQGGEAARRGVAGHAGLGEGAGPRRRPPPGSWSCPRMRRWGDPARVPDAR